MFMLVNSRCTQRRQSAGGQRVKPSPYGEQVCGALAVGDRDLRMTFVIKVLPIRRAIASYAWR
jgi:hypothetical protein